MEVCHFSHLTPIHENGQTLSLPTDIVYGPIANDKVGVQIRNVLENNIDMETFLKRLQYMKGITFQYFFATEKALKLLRQL